MLITIRTRDTKITASKIHQTVAHYSRRLSNTNQKLPSSSPLLNEETCASILDRFPDINTLKKLHSRFLIDLLLQSNPSLGIKLMRSYAFRGETTLARQLFDGITERNVVFFNVMIRSYVNNEMYLDALRVYKDMLGEGFCPDSYTYPCVLKACSGLGDLWFGPQVHGGVVKVGLDCNLFVGNGLVSMYGKCRRSVEARRVLDEMPKRDVVTWNSMVAGYAQSGRFDDALEVCKEMEGLNVKGDSGTMASLLPAVTNTDFDNVAFVKEMFLKVGGRNLVSWNVMIAVYVKNGMPGEAIGLYLSMEENGIVPDMVSSASVLPACGELSALSLGRRIHEHVERKKYRPNLLLENALIDMYAKCGCLKDARLVFDEMQFHDVVSWTSMMCAYGVSGQGRDAVELFWRMQESGLIPDYVAFVSVLAACSHAGLLDEGRYIFDLMAQYGIRPKLEHFACLVDMLGRAGKIDEAYGIIRQMPLKPNERIWGALLNACRVHSNMEIGVLAADQLFQMAPEPSGYYVLLSNIYAKAGRWQEVSTIRSIMENKRIKKKPGISNFELNGKVHTFLAGDRYHPQSEEIYEELEVLVGKMKELGYVPETDSALHDVEEEDKESHLTVHSEKLAIVFAILNTTPHTRIRITKNLRVCGDCHMACKLISKIADREIVVRDTHRFHYFHDGICSCGDYW